MLSLRNSLFAVAATAPLVMSVPVSAAPINYQFAAESFVCFAFPGNPCDQKVSFSGTFTVDTVIDPKVGRTPQFSAVNITLANLVGDILPTPSITLTQGFPTPPGDFFNAEFLDAS